MCTHMRTCLVEDILDDEYGVLGLGHTITARKQFFCLKVKLICQRLWFKARSPAYTMDRDPQLCTPGTACRWEAEGGWEGRSHHLTKVRKTHIHLYTYMHTYGVVQSGRIKWKMTGNP